MPAQRCRAGKMFQFLIGRLDTDPVSEALLEGLLFQFLIGRLDTVEGSEEHEAHKVFQFLIGRLDTEGGFKIDKTDPDCFNSS